jgi:hypothetical protein
MQRLFRKAFCQTLLVVQSTSCRLGGKKDIILPQIKFDNAKLEEVLVELIYASVCKKNN